MKNLLNKNNIMLSLLLIMQGFLVGSCSKYPSNDSFLDRIFRTAKDGDIINISDYTDFDWDDVIISTGRIDKNFFVEILGKNKMFDTDLLDSVFVFRRDNKIVKVIVRYVRDFDFTPYTVNFLLSFNQVYDKLNEIYAYEIFSKEKALFNVKIKYLENGSKAIDLTSEVKE